MSKETDILPVSLTDRLINPEAQRHSLFERARKLGEAVYRCALAANTKPEMQSAGGVNGRERTASTPEFRVNDHLGAFLRFIVDSDHDPEQGSAEWLPNTGEIELVLGHYNSPLPQNLDDAPDCDSEVTIVLLPENVVRVGEDHPDGQMWTASYADGRALDAKNTRTTTTMLHFMADSMADGEPQQPLAPTE